MIDVEIITPEKVLLVEKENVTVNMTLTSGEYEVREGHAPFMANVAAGKILLEKEEGAADIIIAVHGGFVQIAEDNIKVVAKAAELQSNIDFQRAQESKGRAEDRINNPKNYKEDIDVARAKASLKRAKTRLQLKD